MRERRRLAGVSVTKRFGGLTAVRDADITVESGQIVALIGPNGAGKTTLLNALAGTETPTEGYIELDGNDVTKWTADRRAGVGIRRTFQHARPFTSMSLLDGTLVSLGGAAGYRVFGGILRTRAYHRSEAELRRDALDALARVGLAHATQLNPSVLPAGQQRLAELARAYVPRPSFLLLDEPTSGLTSGEATRLFGLLEELRDEGLGLVVVEHRIRTVSEIADQLVVMDEGKVVAVGPPEEIREMQTVLAAYLGGQDDKP